MHQRRPRHDPPRLGEEVLIPSFRSFTSAVRRYYREHAREMPWRSRRSPYRVLVSEVMLQQTGVPRVIPKYLEFIRTFPSLRSLAGASVGEVLAVVEGTRLQQAGPRAALRGGHHVREHSGRMPRTVEELSGLPGLGRATASAFLVFSFNVPLVFIETNIRRVFIHFFFPGSKSVTDSRILPLVEKTLDRAEPREWYYALMDYGAMLGRSGENANRKSQRVHPPVAVRRLAATAPRTGSRGAPEARIG